MSNTNRQNAFNDGTIDEILHSSTMGGVTSGAASSRFSRSDLQQQNGVQSITTESSQVITGQPKTDQVKIPKQTLTLVRVAPFDRSTHAKDQQEFASKRPLPSITMPNNVTNEYSSLSSGSFSTPKRLSETLSDRRQQKHELFRHTSPAPSLLSISHSNHTSPTAKILLSSRTNQERWKANGQFGLKKSGCFPLGSITKSASDVCGFSPRLSKKVNLASTLPSFSTLIERSPPVKRHRCGETVENPVELSDDDDEEIEDREISEEWRKGLSTDIAIGQIWFGKCRLLSHGPSQLLLNLTEISSKKNLTIEFTPYLVEVISLDHILETKAYLRLSGGCTFLSVLISDHHQWQDWALRYKFRTKQSDPVWITMFFGQSALRKLLETVSKELPCYEEVVCPTDHLDVIADNMIDQYPLSRLRLFLSSNLNKRKVRKQVVCRYPVQSRDCITITNGDLESLEPHEFLNDTVIDFKLTYLRLNDTASKISYHIFSSFFYKRFVTSNLSYASVKRWTDKQDLFTKDFWLIPICEALHWTLAVVCYPNIKVTDDRTPVMLYYDSLGGSGKRAFDVICKYLEAALAQPRRLRTLDSVPKIQKEFQLINVCAPRQTNSYDCGIYLLLFAEYFLKDPPKDVCNPHQPEWFKQSIADGHRNKIRGDILKIAYAQSAGNPGPVSTDYVKVFTTSIKEKHCSLSAAVSDESMTNRLTGLSASVSSVAVEDISTSSAEGFTEAAVRDFSNSVGNRDSILIV